MCVRRGHLFATYKSRRKRGRKNRTGTKKREERSGGFKCGYRNRHKHWVTKKISSSRLSAALSEMRKTTGFFFFQKGAHEVLLFYWIFSFPPLVTLIVVQVLVLSPPPSAPASPPPPTAVRYELLLPLLLFLHLVSLSSSFSNPLSSFHPVSTGEGET